MTKKSKPTEHDLEIFHNAVTDATPLKITKRRLLSPKKLPKYPPQREPIYTPLGLNESKDIPTVGGETLITYKQADIANKILRKLGKGQYTVDATLDLHGMTVEEAFQAVDHFLQACLADGFRVVLIVHGKGHHSDQPTLKNKLNQWLRHLPLVLAFCSAGPTHGDRGAMYVLLKRNREESTIG
ncbi:MAG TPA: Smr/MutS family protein [Gammaproteobacteria bacterium]|jgi:DNA-nicking Smr family endonuclease|nr:Smr/MutS family protein [Gammaproteobacteria bacterium]